MLRGDATKQGIGQELSLSTEGSALVKADLFEFYNLFVPPEAQ